MGLGSTAKKLQTLVETAEDLYQRVNDLRERLVRMESTIDETNQRVETVEGDVAELRALAEAVADDQGLDVAAILEDVEGAADLDTDETEDDPS
mgnify:CR=1 FL=1